MRLNENVQVPLGVDAGLRAFLYDNMQRIARKVNAMAFGLIAETDGVATAAPTTGTHKQGDERKNSNPTELGTAGAKYVIDKWKCVASGTPGTWVEMRSLTGN